MSDQVEEVGGAEALRIEAADWLMRQRTSDLWAQEDQAALESWLAKSPAHLLAYWRLEAAWSRTDRLAALRDVPQARPAQARRKNIGSFLTRSVAVAACFAVVGFLLLRSSVPLGREFSTSVGGHETIRLADGSLIELNTNTTVHVLDGGNGRTVTLDKGEAYFQIVHNQASPFEVLVGDRKLVDIGTAFSVRKETNRLQVAIVEGQVRFAPLHPKDGKPIYLSSGDMLVASAGKTSVTRLASPDLKSELGWRRGLLIFYRKPLADAAEEFNRYNQQQIVVVGEAAGKLPVSGALSANDPEQFVRMARNVFGLRVERRNSEILISR